MPFLQNVSIGNRLILSISSFLVMIVVLSAIGIFQVNQINSNLTTINDVNSVKQRYAINFRGSVHDRAIGVRDITIVSGEELDGVVAEIVRLKEDYDRSAVAMDEIFKNPDLVDSKEREILGRIKQTETSTLPIIERVITLRRQNSLEEASDLLLSEARPLFVTWLAQINEFIDYEEEKNQLTTAKVRGLSAGFQTVMFVATIIAVILGGLFGWWLISAVRPLSVLTVKIRQLAAGDLETDIPVRNTKDEVGKITESVQVFKLNAISAKKLEEQAEQERIEAEAEKKRAIAEFASEIGMLASAANRGDLSVRLTLDGKEGELLDVCESLNQMVATVEHGLNEAGRVLAELSEGALSERMEGQFEGDFDRLKSGSNTMAERLSGIVHEIREAANAVQIATTEIAHGTSDLAARTEQQASNLEETAAAMEEIMATVRQNSDSARQATTLSSKARQTAQNGGEIVSNAIVAMDRISDSSKKITDIVKLIDEIAFQTNLLALNAAVEAARAGEAGKGFAVVASEVRALAQRSGDASKEISALIEMSSSQVAEGVHLVNNTGETLEGILEAVQRVADIVLEISSASQEQAAGLDEVNSAVTNMDQMTQQNAALVEQTTAAAQSLEQQAKGLTRHMAFFKID